MFEAATLCCIKAIAKDKMADKSIHFKGLAALRFFAASAVIFHHIEQYKAWKGYPSIWGSDGIVGAFIDAMGHKAVSFFFVLSGFLITYLLLVELKKTGTVALKKFYLRRVLRIWPLYYVVAIIALFVLPQITDFGKWEGLMHESMTLVVLLHLIILPNLLRVTSIQVVGANQAWSVGVEEQFYLIWPLLIRVFKKYVPTFLVSFILIKFGLQLMLFSLGGSLDNSIGKALGQAATLLAQMQIEQMAVGGLGAWWLFSNNQRALKIVYNRSIWFLSLLLLASFFVMENHYLGSTLFEGLVFIVVILNISTNPKVKFNLDNDFFILMGNISYGIYMLHTTIIALLITGLEMFDVSGFGFNLALYILSPLFTISLAYLSYQYFESYFLKFKNRFAVVKSSTNRKSS